MSGLTLRQRFLVTALLAAGCLSVSAQDIADNDMADNKEKARLSYEAFLQLAKTDDPRRPGALRRLADMEVERAEELLIDGDSDAEAHKAYRHAIGLYRDLLSAYPKHADADAVFYQLARALEAVGESEQARDSLSNLVQDYPKSGYLEESEFRRGETWFSAGEYARAAESYAAVIEQGEQGRSPKAFIEQAWYKHGWALFKLADYEQSQSSFLKLLRHRYAPAGQFDASQNKTVAPGSREMLEDALRAMSLGFSYGNGIDDVNALLDRDTAPGFEHLLFQDLGRLYRKEERFHDAALAYRAFVTRLPNALHSAHMQMEVIATYHEAGFTDQELIAKQEFATQYALNQSTDNYWNHHKVEQAPDVVAALKLHLTELTQHFHAIAQNDMKLAPAPGASATEAFGNAVQWYRAWLSSFPDAPESASTHFLLAELLFDGGAFDQAVTAFEYTAYQYPPHEKSAESGYAALLAYAEHARTLSDSPLQAWERRSIDSALQFADSFKEHEFATQVQTHAAERLFKRGELIKALQVTDKLLKWVPAASLSQQRTAWLVRGHSFFDQQNYADAELAYQHTLQLTADSTAADAQQERQNIVERLAASVYKQGEQNILAGKAAQAVDAFLRVAKVAPTSALVATAEYDAASALLDLKAYDRATAVLEAFRQNYPAHKLQSEVTRNLSFVYVETGESDKAGAEMMRLANDATTDLERRTQAAYQAVKLYKSTDNAEQIIASYAYLLNELGISLDAGIEAREEIAGVYQKMSNESQHLSWLRSIIDANSQAGAAATPASRTAAAYATLLFAEREWAPFVAVRLDEPLQENLKLKKRYMENLLQQLGQAAEFNVGPVTTAATYRIAAAYAEMADAMMTSARPSELNTEELEEYEFLLEEQAFPFEEQSIEVHENNARRVEDNIYDAWVRKSFKDLAGLMPGRYAKTEQGVSIADVLE